MGVIDEIKSYCPSCGAKLVFQSKAMPEPGRHYDLDETAYDANDLPLTLAADLDGARYRCTCGALVELRPCVSRVAMLPRAVKEDSDA